MNTAKNRKVEFGDFQTPEYLADQVCKRLTALGVCPDIIVEPTCGLGAFVLAAAEAFPKAQQILGFEVNVEYLEALQQRTARVQGPERIQLEQTDFFATDWQQKLAATGDNLLVLGNFPWVTNAGLSSIGGANLPVKNNFLHHTGLDAMTGKANFDISEWMLIEALRWFERRSGIVAMLVKTAVARKILAYAQKKRLCVHEASIIKIDAKKAFNAAVDACLLVIKLGKGQSSQEGYDYTVYESIEKYHGHRVGYRNGLTVADLETFDRLEFLIGQSPQKWRSGIKHDAAQIMELTRTAAGLKNGLGQAVDIEDTYLYPLLKGSDIGSEKAWRGRYVLATQRFVGERTDIIRELAPKTWQYLLQHQHALDARASTIYKNNPAFAIFGVGDYAFRPWRIAICALYKTLKFRLVEPVADRPVMFDDTVYYLSFDTRTEAEKAFSQLTSEAFLGLLKALIFWDEKRPIKTSLLNVVDWTRVNGGQAAAARQMILF
ncbi:MAG: hypothetical protein ACKN9T_01225 [Candidatus Methylumidiphilus sp.]